MHPPGASTVVVRHGELGVKSDQVRMKMELRLRETLAAMLDDRGIDADVYSERNRLYVATDESAVETATDVATNAFGVVSASPAVEIDPTMDAICETLAATTRAAYDGGLFAIRARRAGESDVHAFSTQDLNETGGQAVWDAIEAMGGDPEVDLDDPAFEVFVEARPEKAFLFLEKRPGPGGLPLGTQRPVVALISGGIDSPVAAWELMTRGAPVIPLYVDLGRYGGADHRARAVATVDALARYVPGQNLELRIAPAGEYVERIADAVDATRMLTLRRFMYRIAEGVARKAEAVGIVTGESIGQKSSQTSSNLAVLDAATELPVHRPLLTTDKTTISQRARKIGTYQDATIPAGCNRLAPEFPETNATLEQVEAAEPDALFEWADSVARAVRRT